MLHAVLDADRVGLQVGDHQRDRLGARQDPARDRVRRRVLGDGADQRAVAMISTARRGAAATVRYWRVVPGATANRIAEGPLEVVGAFTIEVQRSGTAANEAWDAR